MTVFNAVLPVATLALGYVGTMLTESRRDARAERRATTERTEEERLAVERRRGSAELWVLDRAYAELADFARVCGAIHNFDMREVKSTGTYMPTNMSAAQSDAFFITNQRVRRTLEQILDDGVRSAVRDAVSALSTPSMMFHGTADEAEAAMLEATTRALRAYEALGTRIRDLVKAGTIMPEVSPEYHAHVIGPSGLLDIPENGASK